MLTCVSSVLVFFVLVFLFFFFFLFPIRRLHTRLQGDWSSDVCSSDLAYQPLKARAKTGSHPMSTIVIASALRCFRTLNSKRAGIRWGSCYFGVVASDSEPS